MTRLEIIFPQRLWPDEALYSWYAQQIHEHPNLIFSREIIEYHPPFFSCWLALGQNLASPPEGYRIITTIFNLLGLVGIYLLGIALQNPFAGLFSAIILAFHPLYFDSSLITSDRPLSAILIFYLLLVAHSSRQDSRSLDRAVGLVGAMVIGIKWSGVLIIPFLLIYAWLLRRDQQQHLAPKLIAWLTLPILTTLFFLINNRWQTGSWWPNLSVLTGFSSVQPAHFYLFNGLNILWLPFLIPLFLFGLWAIGHSKATTPKILTVWFWVSLIGISLVPEKLIRFSLPLLPTSLLIAAIGYEKMGACLGPSAWRQRVWRLAALLLVAGHCWYFFPKVKSLTAEQSSSFSGFFAAGHWIKQHSTPDTLLWAGSPRLIRYTTGLQLAEFGGRIQSFPSHPETWKEIVSRTRAPVLLAVDAWERRQPSWIYPLTQAKIHFLTESGFQLVKTVRAVCEDPSHCPTAIWIFLKPATTAKE